MKKVFFIISAILLIGFTEVKADTFQITNATLVGKDGIALETTYGGSIYMYDGQNANPIYVKVHKEKKYISMRCYAEKSEETIFRFLKERDFYTFRAFLDNTSHEAAPCWPVVSGDSCVVYVFF